MASKPLRIGMSHKEQRDFCLIVKKRYPEYFISKKVLDIGSGDINGNNNSLFENCCMIRNDIAYGPNVDVISFAHELPFVDEYFNTIISTECLEHDRTYSKTLVSVVRMLEPGGLFIMACATTGRPEHGTSRCKPYQVFATRVEGLEDYYKNLTEEDIREAIDIDLVFVDYQFSVNNKHHDLYFWGVKK